VTAPGCWELGFPPLQLSDRERTGSEALQLEVEGWGNEPRDFLHSHHCCHRQKAHRNMAQGGRELDGDNSPVAFKVLTLSFPTSPCQEWSSQSNILTFMAHLCLPHRLNSGKQS
jgi:hypothetical protein